MDESGFEELKKQLLQSREEKNAVSERKTDEISLQSEAGSSEKIRERRESESRAVSSRGDESNEKEKKSELDDDHIVEFWADKKPMKLTIKELKERAAGDIAVKNRMHQIAEERKKIKETLTSFANHSKNDPLRALEEFAEHVQEANPDFSFDEFLSALAEQAQRLSKMDVSELKAQKLQSKLERTEERLSSKEQESAVSERVEQMKDSMGLTESQFQSYVDYILENDDLVEDLENDFQLLDRVQNFAQEVQFQQDAYSVISEIVSDIPPDDALVLDIASVIRANPDFDEKDIQDIVHGIFKNRLREKTSKRTPKEDVDIDDLENSGASSFEILKAKLLHERKTKAER